MSVQPKSRPNFYDWPDEWWDERIVICHSDELQEEERDRCSAHGWDSLDYFMSYYVVTQDEHDKEDPFKPFPYISKPYLRDMAYLWYESEAKGRPLFVAKSAQIMISWLMCACLTWDALFLPGRRNTIVSKKELDADNLLQRCGVIYDNLPFWLKQSLVKPVYCEIYFPDTKSVITAAAQGPQQLRQYVVSNLLLDEFAFQDYAEETFMAASPRCGRITAVSTANPGYFERMVCDATETES